MYYPKERFLPLIAVAAFKALFHQDSHLIQ